jgi:DNA invertase Pin-like site-specific DNA recombinase
MRNNATVRVNGHLAYFQSIFSTDYRKKRVSFVSLTEALSLTTPASRAMAALLTVFAEFEDASSA